MKRIEPSPGQESVWDYPRPPRLETAAKLVQVFFAGFKIAETWNAKRVLETSHPPTYYLPPEDIDQRFLVPSAHATFCEYKGLARYFDLAHGDQRSMRAAWSYPDPSAGFEEIRDHLAFYPSRVEACFVDGEKVSAQDGDFYGGWITSQIVGPFKGGAGTWSW